MPEQDLAWMHRDLQEMVQVHMCSYTLRRQLLLDFQQKGIAAQDIEGWWRQGGSHPGLGRD